MTDRPTFLFEGQEVRAAGVLFYKKTKRNDILVLAQTNFEKKKGWEDLGGKTDVRDASVFETAAREVAEETNNIINFNCTLRQLETVSFPVYNRECKYLLFLVPANSFICRLGRNVFSDTEKVGGTGVEIKRDVQWLPFRKLFYYQHHDRLEYSKKDILNFLYSRI